MTCAGNTTMATPGGAISQGFAKQCTWLTSISSAAAAWGAAASVSLLPTVTAPAPAGPASLRRPAAGSGRECYKSPQKCI